MNRRIVVINSVLGVALLAVAGVAYAVVTPSASSAATTERTVTTTATTTYTSPIGAADLIAGQVVSVVGTSPSATTVTATAITVSS